MIPDTPHLTDPRHDGGASVAEAIDQRVKAAAETLDPKDYEPFIRAAADNFYERLMTTTQDYLRVNVEWNLQADIDQLRNRASYVERQLHEISDLLGVSVYSQEARIGRLNVLLAQNEPAVAS